VPLVLIGLLALVAGLCLAPMSETDIFFRLRVGQEIVAAGAVPRLNLFSFTYPGHPDLDPAWLFDVAAAGVFRVGGFPALVLAKTAVVVAVFAGAFALCRRRGSSPVIAALTLAAAALVMRERLVERPHLFSFAGELSLLAVLAAAEARPRRLWAMVPLTVLWANLHAGAFLAPALLAASAAGALLDRRPDARTRPGGRQAHPPAPASLLLVAGATAGALLLTPVGTGIFRYLAFHVGIFALHPVDEFRPVGWTSDAALIVYGAAAVALVAAAPGRRWRELLPALMLALLAVRTVRFGADFALVVAPLAARALTDRVRSLPLPPAWISRAPYLAGPLLIAIALVPRLSAAAAGRPPLSIALDEATLPPLPALRFAEAHGLRERMYNDFEDGAYLAFQGYPRHRVFVDPRLPAYPAAFHQLLGRAALPRAEWDAALSRHGVETALLTHAGINHRIGWWDPARWALVYRADDARLFVRRLPRFLGLIAAQEIPATFTFTPAAGAATVPLEAPPPGSPVPACEWQRRLGDLLFDLDDGRPQRALRAYTRALASPPGCLDPAREAPAAAWVGAMELAGGDPARALPALDRTRALAPGDLASLTNRALALEALGRTGEATAAWSELAARAPGTALGERARHRAGR
jgi:tetratricopeptide (TPR) repeat protein